MALLILELLQRIFLMSSLMLLLVWLIFFMVLIKLLPNLGGFFMFRSYYPSECHADYFVFERIEALKPAIEACGISTLSQSPMLGFHKQMDNRIKLLEEILSFRMQGVEFDNGDMYVDGHKAASDVRDEFVSVTEKLMDELAQCYNVLPQLDI